MFGRNHAGSPADPAAAVMEPEAGPSRRSILWGAAGAGAAGLAAAAMARTAPAFAAATAPPASRTRAPDALAAAPASRAASRAANEAAAAGPVVVHLRDAQSGEMDVFAGTKQVRLRDRDLAARLARAVR
jgi:hypothetical protein